MKWNNIFHTLGALGCIVGIFGMVSYGWHVWQWPMVALLWIITSYFNASYAGNLKKTIEQLDKERAELIDRNIKMETRVWEAEMKLTKALKK
jgi:hypothetical protein